MTDQTPDAAPQEGQIVDFTFDTATRGGGRHVRARHYARGEIVRVGKRLSIRVLDNASRHADWRETYVGTIRVVAPERIIPVLPDA